MSDRDRQRREMIHGYAPMTTMDDLPTSLESRAQHRRREKQLEGRVEFWQAQVKTHFDRAQKAEASLADRGRELEEARATIHRMDEANISALRKAGAFTGGVVESISALAERAEKAERELEEARQALAAAVVPLEVIAGQHRVKPYRELSPGLVERVNTSIAVIRAALGKDEG